MAADACAQKQAHLAVGHTLELVERCVDLERIREEANTLSTHAIFFKTASKAENEALAAIDAYAQKQAHCGKQQRT